MISRARLRLCAQEWGVGDVVVENDYVLGWLLWGLRCVSVEIHSGQFSRWGLLPHAPCQPGASPPPGELANLGAHAGSTTGC